MTICLVQDVYRIIIEFLTGYSEENSVIMAENPKYQYITVPNEIRCSVLRRYLTPELIPKDKIALPIENKRYFETIIPKSVREVMLYKTQENISYDIDQLDNVTIYVSNKFTFTSYDIFSRRSMNKLVTKNNTIFDFRIAPIIDIFYLTAPGMETFTIEVTNTKMKISINLLSHLIYLPEIIDTLIITNSYGIYRTNINMNQKIFQNIKDIIVLDNMISNLEYSNNTKTHTITNDKKQMAMIDIPENAPRYVKFHFDPINILIPYCFDTNEILCISVQLLDYVKLTDNITRLRLYYTEKKSICDMTDEKFTNIEHIYSDYEAEILFPPKLQFYHVSNRYHMIHSYQIKTEKKTSDFYKNIIYKNSLF